MDAALSIAAPVPAALPAAGIATAETDGEGGFAAALTRSLAAAVEAGPAMAAPAAPAEPATSVTEAPVVPRSSASPVVAVPATPAPGTAAAVPVGVPAPIPALAQAFPPEAPPLEPAVGEAPTIVTEPVETEPEPEVEEERAVEAPMAGEAVPVPLLPSAILVPAQPPRPQTPIQVRISASSDRSGDEADSPVADLVLPSPVLPSTPAPSKAPTTAASLAPKTAPVSPGGMAPLVPHSAPEAEAAASAVLPETPIPSKPGRAEALGAATAERPAAAGSAGTPSLPPELAGYQTLPRTSFAEAATPVAAPPPPSPARQVSSVAVALAFAPGGSNGFSLSLEPAELGRVEIHVQREGDSHSIRVTAERPETLALLQRDRHELDRGLAEAGLRVDSAGIDFSLDTLAGSGGGGSGQEPGTGQRGDSRGHAGGAVRPPAPEREAPPPRLLRSLLDLNI